MAKRPLKTGDRRRTFPKHTPEGDRFRCVRSLRAISVRDDQADVFAGYTRVCQRQFDRALNSVAVRSNVQHTGSFRRATGSEEFAEDDGLARLSVGSPFEHDRRGALAKNRAAAFTIERTQSVAHEAKLMIMQDRFRFDR